MQLTKDKTERIGDLNVVKRVATGVAGQEIVVGWNVYRGKRYVTVRICARSEGGELRPTRRGITFDKRFLDEIISGMDSARHESPK